MKLFRVFFAVSALVFTLASCGGSHKCSAYTTSNDVEQSGELRADVNGLDLEIKG